MRMALRPIMASIKWDYMMKRSWELYVGGGEDECGHYLSYYDRWDFSPTVGALGRVDMGFIGKPVEIYNRIYFQPGTRIIRDSPTDRPYFETPDGETMELPMKKVENGK